MRGPDFQSLAYAPYFDNYLQYIESNDVQQELRRSSEGFVSLLKELPESSLSLRYAPDKWTVAQLVQHVIDTEMIFVYRALSIARDPNELNLRGFDEDTYAANAVIDQLRMEEWIAFFDHIRSGTMTLARTFSADQMLKTGVTSGYQVRVDLLLFVSAGHTLHHAKVLKERYLPHIESGLHA